MRSGSFPLPPDLRLLIAVAGLGAAAPAFAAGAPISGLYSDVEMSGETGDLGGFEIDIHGEAPEPYAEFVMCEGWCNRAVQVPLTIDGDGISFDYVENYVDANGQPAGSRTARISGRLADGGLVLQGEGDLAFEPVLLAPREDRFGLDVAEQEAGEAEAAP